MLPGARLKPGNGGLGRSNASCNIGLRKAGSFSRGQNLVEELELGFEPFIFSFDTWLS